MHALLTPAARAALSARRLRARLPRHGGDRHGPVVRRRRSGGRARRRRGGADDCRARECSARSRATWSSRPAMMESSGRPTFSSRAFAPGEELSRRTDPPARGRILSVDRKVLAEGPPEARVSPLGALGGSIAGQMGVADDPQERRKVYTRGLDADTPIGVSGLERVFERELAGRPAGRLLAGTRVIAESRAAAGTERAHHHRQRGSSRRRSPPWPGGSAGSRRSTPAPPRCGPGRHRVLGAPAARVHVQDRHHDRRARAAPRQEDRPVPGRDLRADRRRGARERERRVLRRQLQGQLRPLLQLGLRAARRRGRRPPAGRRGRALWLERLGDDRRRAAQHAAAGERDQQPARGRRQRDRPGQGARHAARDGIGRADRGRGRRAHRPLAAARGAAGARSASRTGGSHARSRS